MVNMKALQVHNYGGPEVLRFEYSPRPAPGSDELLIRELVRMALATERALMRSTRRVCSNCNRLAFAASSSYSASFRQSSQTNLELPSQS